MISNALDNEIYSPRNPAIADYLERWTARLDAGILMNMADASIVDRYLND